MKKAWVFFAFLAFAVSSRAAELTFSTTTMHFDEMEDKCLKSVTEIATRLGAELQLVELSFGRALVWANNAKIDGLVARTDSIEKAYPNLIKFGGKCASIKLDLVTMQSNAFDFVDWNSIPAGYSLGYVRGVEIILTEVAQKNKKLNLVDVGIRSHLVDMFLSERFELLLTPSSLIPGLEKRMKKPLSVVKRSAIEINMYPYIHKKHRELLGAKAVVME